MQLSTYCYLNLLRKIRIEPKRFETKSTKKSNKKSNKKTPKSNNLILDKKEADTTSVPTSKQKDQILSF